MKREDWELQLRDSFSNSIEKLDACVDPHDDDIVIIAAITRPEVI